MNRILLALSCIVTLIGFTAYSTSTPDATEPYLVLSVTSTIEGQEITFEGKYFSTEGEDLAEVVEARQTPFQVAIQGEADEFFALFRKLDGKADLSVKLETGGASAESTGEVGVVMRRGEKVMGTGL